MYRVIVAAKTSPLYHGTSWENAVKIIESNTLKANVSNETETSGVSFTRNKDEAYAKVVIVIDQELLSYNYGIHPVYRDGIAGKDLAEERVDRTINNIRKYIVELRFNNPVYVKTLRRTIVDHFNDTNLLDVAKFSDRDFNIVYSINEVIECADKYHIPLDKTFEECRKYIEMYKGGEFDTEYSRILDAKQSKQKRQPQRKRFIRR